MPIGHPNNPDVEGGAGEVAVYGPSNRPTAPQTSRSSSSSSGAPPSSGAPLSNQSLSSVYDINAKFLKGLGVDTSATSTDPGQLQAVEDFLDAQHAGDVSVLDGFNFKGVQSVSDFMRALGWAEQFAAVTGYRYFPKAALLEWMASQAGNQQWGGFDKQKAFDIFFQNMPKDAQEKMPYASVGMTAEDFNTATSSFVDAFERATGSRDAAAFVNLGQAVKEHWSTDRMMQMLTKNADFNAKYGWVQYGKTYTDWQNYKVQNQQEVSSRFGENAASGGNADMFFLQNLQHPLQRVNTASGGGGQVRGPASQQTQDPSHASEVR